MYNTDLAIIGFSDDSKLIFETDLHSKRIKSEILFKVQGKATSMLPQPNKITIPKLKRILEEETEEDYGVSEAIFAVFN